MKRPSTHRTKHQRERLRVLRSAFVLALIGAGADVRDAETWARNAMRNANWHKVRAVMERLDYDYFGMTFS